MLAVAGPGDGAGVVRAAPSKVRFEPGAVRINTPFDFGRQLLPGLFDPSTGLWTPYRAVAQLFDEIEVRTRVTGAIKISVRELEDPTPNPALAALAPAFILRGPAGTLTIAPYGEVPDATSGAVLGVGLLLGGATLLTGGGLLAGWWLGRREVRR
jgi:hypothetical protein